MSGGRLGLAADGGAEIILIWEPAGLTAAGPPGVSDRARESPAL